MMSSEHIPWSRGFCLSGMIMPPMVRCGLPISSANLTPFFRSAVGTKMLRPRSGTISARRLAGSWAPWLSRMVNEIMPVPTP
ncbi:unnamed protein product [Ascophyllum nodosum]